MRVAALNRKKPGINETTAEKARGAKGRCRRSTIPAHTVADAAQTLRQKPNWGGAASSYKGFCLRLFVARPVQNGIPRTKLRRMLGFEGTLVEHEMTKHIVQLPNPGESLPGRKRTGGRR
jgi:hypothetical protein